MTVSEFTKELLSVPGNWGDELLLRRAEILHYTHLSIILYGIAYFFIPARIVTGQAFLVLLLIVIALIGSLLLRWGKLSWSGIWSTASLWLLFTAGSLTEGGIHSSAFFGNIMVTVFACMAFGPRMMYFFAVATILAGTGIVYLHLNRMLPAPAVNYTEVNILVDFTIYIAITCLYMSVAIRRINASTKKYEAELEERKRIQEITRKSEERYRSLYENSTIGIYRSTPDGRILFANPALIRMLGYSSFEELATRNLEQEGFEPDYPRSTFLDAIEKTGEIRGLESTWKTKTGVTLAIRENARAMRSPEGETLYYDGTVEDISDRKHLEEKRLELERQLLQSQKMESLGILAGGIAHDFNNLLVGILGNISLLRYRLNLTDSNEDLLLRAEEAAERATVLTQKMLAYSGKGHFQLTKMDLNEVIRENWRLFRNTITKASTCHLELAAEPILVEASAAQLQQLLLNLLINASEALAEQSGTITIKSGTMECDEDYLASSRIPVKPSPGRFVYLTVTDTGQGMSAETQSRLFDPFYTTKGAGRGLGMSVALGIVQGHKGAILIQSALECGTTICVLIPTIRQQETGVERMNAFACIPSKSEASAQTNKIIVADDEELVRDLGLEIVKELGFQGLAAADGEEAVLLFQQHAGEIACVVLDLTMPKMDGLQASQVIRRLSPEVRVILCSGYDRENIIEQFPGEFPPYFLSKPFRAQELRSKIIEVLQA